MPNNKINSDGEGFIRRFLKDPSNYKMQEMIAFLRANDFNDREVLLLATGMAQSGKILKLKNTGDIYDIPSTGGPTSLSTLLCPLFLRSMKNDVLKLGVSGRPAGAIDVLAQIEGYNINPELHQLESWFKKQGYVHFIADKNYTPLDAILFNFRKYNDSINIPSLVIASLLSKKIAVGINRIGLDIRVSNFGNFGKTFDVSRKNAIRFNRVAMLAGIVSKCFLTNGNIPQQPYIGRGESILALNKIFSGKADSFLQQHTDICFKMASSVSGEEAGSYSHLEIRDIFFENILIQGGLMESFDQISFNTTNGHVYSLAATKDGYLKINLKCIRSAIVIIQNKCSGKYPDPCGIILKYASNDLVKNGDIICTFRCIHQYLSEFEENLNGAFNYMDHTIPQPEFEEIKNG